MPLFLRPASPAGRGVVPPSDPSGEPREQRTIWSDSLGRLGIRCLQLLLVLAVVSLIVIALRQLTVVVIPVLLALIIASALAPLVSFLRRHGWPSIVATLAVLAAAVIVVGGLIWAIVLAVENQWDDLADSAADGAKQLTSLVTNLPFDISDAQIEDAKQAALDFVTSSQFGTGALAGVSAAGNFLTGLAVFVVALFFFLRDGPMIWDFLCRPFTGAGYRRVRRIGEVAVGTFGGYVRGTATVALVDAIGIGGGLLIMNLFGLEVPLVLPIAVVVFIAAFIPIVGATAAGIVAALVALVTSGPLAALIVVIIVVIVNQLEGNFLQPVVMGRTLSLHPMVILIALTIGTVLGGIVGAILSVPLTAVAWKVVGVWNGEDRPVEFARKKRPERMVDR
ncbi:AI-2E family transporter [Schumannella sp. 10F1B-5-1]|uniref:AI-2E family transporter n=1 Tax=Schumannella sp. 10F1B-5-1 TaxID=2590780 RepID=UPI001131E093|nr:AI-2E family transporter [Schumannella sp. 10F1B-5-1]TPW78356.1 AI-2E family transporter [Schumannella sp. 10F1B-5-1]